MAVKKAGKGVVEISHEKSAPVVEAVPVAAPAKAGKDKVAAAVQSIVDLLRELGETLANSHPNPERVKELLAKLKDPS